MARREEIIERATQLLGQYRSTTVATMLRREYSFSIHTAQRYIALARAAMLAFVNRDADTLRADLVTNLDAVIYDRAASPRDRLGAMKLKASLLGLRILRIQTGASPEFPVLSEDDTVDDIRTALPALDVGSPCGPAMAVPDPPATPGTGLPSPSH